MQSQFFPTFQQSLKTYLLFALRRCRLYISRTIEKWRLERERKRTIRILSELPDEILRDIGWPTAVGDRFHPTESKKNFDNMHKRIKALLFASYGR